MKALQFILILLLYISGSSIYAQDLKLTAEMNEAVELYNLKINELIDKHQKNGFEILKEQKLPLRSNIDMVIQMPLHAGDWYHFTFVGDPNAEKMRATLFLEGFGDLIQDRIIVNREKEFWTEFSFLCPQSGLYELTLFQKASISRPLSYLTIFKRKDSIVGTE